MNQTIENIENVEDKDLTLEDSVQDIGLERIVVIGGGFAGANLIHSIDLDKYQVVLLDKNNYRTFQPLLYEVATTSLEAETVTDPLYDLENHKNFIFRQTEVSNIDPEQNCLHTSKGIIAYDHLVIATGASPNFYGMKDDLGNNYTLNSVEDAVDLRKRLIKKIEETILISQKNKEELKLSFCIAGGGPTGVELAGSLAEARNEIFPKIYPGQDFSKMKIYLVEGLSHLLPGMSEKASQMAEKYMDELGVEVKLGVLVGGREDKKITLNNDETLFAENLIWTAGVQGDVLPGIQKKSIKKSRYVVDRVNRIRGYKNVYALGDNAMMSTEKYEEGHPMLAQIAEQQGIHMGHNFTRLAKGKKMKKFIFKNRGTMAIVCKNKGIVDLPFNWTVGGWAGWVMWKGAHLIKLYNLRQKFVVMINWMAVIFTGKKRHAQV